MNRTLEQTHNKFLTWAAILSFGAALAHLGCIVFGASWYRFFGAGEQMASLAEQGSMYPTIVTSVLVVTLCTWSLYALSGARIIFRIPFVRLALCLISAIYLTRGVAFVLLMPMFPENSLSFWLVSSSICLAIGALYMIGTLQEWSNLRLQGA